MDPQTIINGLFAIAGGLSGWVLKNVHEAVKELYTADITLSEKVHKIDLLVAGQYVRKEDMDKMVTALFTKLDRIETKLDGKADKR